MQSTRKIQNFYILDDILAIPLSQVTDLFVLNKRHDLAQNFLYQILINLVPKIAS